MTSGSQRAIERGLIISQGPLPPHRHSHWMMLVHAFGTKDRREAVGQLIRPLPAPLGPLPGAFPAATRAARISMPMPRDRAAIIGAKAE
ncbi:MAG: DUF3703 domain-containing protein [Erythrobacter sp.]